MLDEAYYVGELTENGFILKRNFGNRRQPIFGMLHKNHFEIKVKNEIVHQIFYIFGALLLLSLMIFLLSKGDYALSLLVLVMMALIFISDRYQRKKELKLFLDYILKNQNQNI